MYLGMWFLFFLEIMGGGGVTLDPIQCFNIFQGLFMFELSLKVEKSHNGSAVLSVNGWWPCSIPIFNVNVQLYDKVG